MWCYNVYELREVTKVMGKSVYSVVLNDELVGLLDRVAVKNGVSRSVMLNKIMAEYLTVETPELKIENIFSEVEKLINESDALRFISQPSLTMASIKSALCYRYSPTVRYSFELFENSDALGQLKVTLRTQNPDLIKLVNEFFGFFVSMEIKYTGEAQYNIENGKLIRILRKPETPMTAAELGEGITVYVRLLDKIMNLYFNNLGNAGAIPVMEKIYRDNLAKTYLI